MRKRLVRALIFVAVAVGAAVGGASAAGALDFDFGTAGGAIGGDSTSWD
jgi:hypothetical protein